MPGLIVNQGTTDRPRTPREKILERTSRNNASAIRWMWICTVAITLAIVGVWFYGFATQISFFSWSSSSEAQLLKNTKDQWNFFFTNQPTSTLGVKAEVSAALNHIIASSTPATAEIIATSTTTTTTVTSTF